ncbi:MAG TPA: YhjD/YihY/BrkB family envelope integrity protein, partial [Gaiellaceae bacterium]
MSAAPDQPPVERQKPQPELEESNVADPTPGDLSKRDYGAILVRAVKKSLNDHVTNLAAALAYYAFFAIPSLMLVSVGVFSLTGDENAVSTIVNKLQGVVPPEATKLIDDTLHRVIEAQQNSGLSAIVVGGVLALWTLTGAMDTLMWALNAAYGREETRGFVKRRLTALVMVVLM